MSIGKKVLISGFIITLLVLQMMFWDLPLSIYVHENISEKTRNLFSIITLAGEVNFMLSIVAFIFIFDRFYLKKKNEHIKTKIGYMILIQALATICVHVLKYGFGRYRLEAFFTDGLYGFVPFNAFADINFSFPSGHSQSIFTFITSLLLFFPPQKHKKLFYYVCFGVAGSVAISRVIIGEHFLTDIIIGALFGIYISYFWFLKLYKKKGLKKSLLLKNGKK